MPARKTFPPKRQDVMVSLRMPKGLKEWYERRALEEGTTFSAMIREILQAKRMPVSGK